MGHHFYVKSDGNGGLNVSKTLAFIAVFVSCIIPLITVSVYAATMDSKINNLQKIYDTTGPIHTKIIEDMKGTDQVLDKRITIQETKLDNIQSTLNEIKSDVKDIKNQG